MSVLKGAEARRLYDLAGKNYLGKTEHRHHVCKFTAIVIADELAKQAFAFNENIKYQFWEGVKELLTKY